MQYITFSMTHIQKEGTTNTLTEAVSRGLEAMIEQLYHRNKKNDKK
jgi:sulfur transfer protein SufE